MSRIPLRWYAVGLVLVVSGVDAQAQQNPVAIIGNPVNGPQAGSISVTASWVNCNGIDRVLITVTSKTPQGRIAPLKTVVLQGPPALLPNGNWATTIRDLTTGNTVVGIQVDIIGAPPPGGGPAPNIAQDIKPNLNLVVPLTLLSAVFAC